MNQYEPTTTAPTPIVEAEFHVEPHPDPLVRALIAQIEELRLEVEHLKEELYNGTNPG